MNPKKFKSKKAVSIWISWMLVTLIAVILSVFVYNWIVGLTKSTMQTLEKKVYDTTDCDYTGIVITSACQSTQTLYMNLTNNRNLLIDSIIVRTYDIYENPEVKEKSIELRPSESKQIAVLKQGIVRKIEVLPVVKRQDAQVICRTKLADMNRPPNC
ncbi:MAG TPA: hypothetical protein VI894_03240 [Candidatus Nanoarchaeia archaeon]|nr:hypothetical protein [Candidatus Nanoarchaeia archaeon]